MNYSDPAGEDMDAMNEFRKKIQTDDELMAQALRMMNPDDQFGQLYLPTREHIRVLVREIVHLREQIELSKIYEKQDPY